MEGRQRHTNDKTLITSIAAGVGVQHAINVYHTRLARLCQSTKAIRGPSSTHVMCVL